MELHEGPTKLDMGPGCDQWTGAGPQNLGADRASWAFGNQSAARSGARSAPARIAESLAALAAWYDVELTYTSNPIEGNTLTRSETAIILEKGIAIGGKPLKDHLEAIGHKAALDYIRVLAGREERLREGDIREIHRLVIGPRRSRRSGAVQPAPARDSRFALAFAVSGRTSGARG
ncbi:MAG: hypothetical protein JOY71_18585 [Acetobacteraceae bacterium]|nr:hypothetical protein [Acetobacteraceae bacterium]MBV8524101.1 hypothetical protein [Acetobacteraceae bacterium]MBV8588894.1 hypothetical protein [Acetobacteraceae bacterium]